MSKVEKVKKEGLNYFRMKDLIEKKYKIELRDYHKFYKKSNPDWGKYMDFWGWMIDNQWSELRNDTFEYWPILEILEEEETPNWIKEITQLFYNEFKDEIDEYGGLTVWISW